MATPDVVVIIIGANDVMRLKRLSDALWPLTVAVHDLRRAGARVVVATCPDLGTVQPFTQPLRFFAHWSSRLMATGQAIVVLRAGGRTVSLADTLGPLFRSEPADMFSAWDHLHPSALGYRAAADAILPSVCAAAGYPRPEDRHVPHRVYRKGSHHPLAWWAFRASRRVGARLTAAESETAHERAAA
ncbi:GDSL-type esterase/lipase family protein [Microbacterium elymi]|uniref:GDSL-type esterase/lipase family protein n=1 Tax=Microbacterium elymi TaxID=2909587 RepID=A0ABY5NI43_9MICO|nr:GDSL-type esterase/lipase family protein [Microbacterium elymi]UUT34857.1 GDSL-type esterase/lipase family protein [Microbacterium elymi]